MRKTEIKNFLQTHNLQAQKRFGQNFLTNEQTLQRIVNTADIQPDDQIIEIGPGLGVLTRELIKKAGHVTAIEFDRGIVATLKKDLIASNLAILEMDALQYEPPKSSYKVVANIPYNITSPLLNHFLQAANKPTSMTLLVQKEVADKICLREKNKTSILSLQVRLFGEPLFVKKVPAGHFYPAPKVDSAILHIKIFQPEDPRYIKNEQALRILWLAKMAFAQRRKMLSNTLPKDLLTKSGIAPNRRPETLSINEWQKIAMVTN